MLNQSKHLNFAIASMQPLIILQTDEFELHLLNLGRISHLLLGHGEHGRGKGWFAAHAALNFAGPDGGQMEAVFACNR